LEDKTMQFYSLFAPAGGASGGQQGSPVSMIVIIVLMLGMMYFMMIRPQKKKQKAEQSMRDNLQIGDEVTTIGGILGRVVTVKEDSLVIETGADRTKFKVTRWAVSQNNTANERMQEEREAAKAAVAAEKEARLAEKGGSGRKKSRKQDGE
jgi:preprotein translocase subunit YajC